MIKKRKGIFFVVFVLLILAVIMSIFLNFQNRKSQTILNLTAEDKRTDFNVLCNILDESYPFWEEVKQAGIDKESIYKEYAAKIEETETDIAYFKEINYFLKELKGFGHLSVLDGYGYRMYVDALTVSNQMLTEKEEKSIAPLVEVLTSTDSQKLYSLLDQSHEGFRSLVGLKEEYQNTGNANVVAEQSVISTEILKGGKVAYIKIPGFGLTNYQRDKSVLADFFAEISQVPNLIIDIRGNSGGSDLYWEDLIVAPNAARELVSERYYLFHANDATSAYVSANEITVKDMALAKDMILSEYADTFSGYTVDTAKFAPAENPYKGKIWVLVDDKVYSASENFAMFCKNTGFATLIGTATGGDGGIADPILLSLPKSGLIVRFSMFYGLNADGSGNELYGTAPDVAISESEDALETCLRLIE